MLNLRPAFVIITGMKQLAAVAALLCALTGLLHADVIFMRDGQEIRGVVTEDYHDRISISTETAETTYFKKDIERIEYETADGNLIKLGAFYKDKGEYKTALYYYQAAARLNPDSKEAQDGALLVNNILLQKKENELRSRVEMMRDTEMNMGKESPEPLEPPSLEEKDRELQARVGISITNEKTQAVVGSVLKDSSAAEAGLKTGDIIVSVWGKMLKYMQPEDIYATFLGSSVSELKIVIERAVSVETNKRGLFGGAERLLDGKLMMEFQGLTVAAVKEPGALARAGVLSGDMITGINEVPTRYMSLDAAYRLIERSHDSRVTLEVQRECIVWKKG